MASEALLPEVGVAAAGAGQVGAGQSPRSLQQLGQATRGTRMQPVSIETPVPGCPPARGYPRTATRATFWGLKPVPLPPRSQLIALMHPEAPALPPSY